MNVMCAHAWCVAGGNRVHPGKDAGWRDVPAEWHFG